MAETNLYTLYSKLDDLLFLVETQLKNLERTSQADIESTDKLRRMIMDAYVSHPDNTQGPKLGRWSNYTSLADKLEKFNESYATAKGLHARSVQDLVKFGEMLSQVKIALASIPQDIGLIRRKDNPR